MKLDKDAFLEQLEKYRNVSKACDAVNISRMGVWKAMHKDPDFKTKVEAIMREIIPKPPKTIVERAIEKVYVHPAVEYRSDPIEPIAPAIGAPETKIDISPTPADIAPTLRNPTIAYCSRCHRTYKIPQDNTSSLICMGCNWSYNIKERTWHEIGYPYKRNSLEGILDGR